MAAQNGMHIFFIVRFSRQVREELSYSKSALTKSGKA